MREVRDKLLGDLAERFLNGRRKFSVVVFLQCSSETFLKQGFLTFFLNVLLSKYDNWFIDIPCAEMGNYCNYLFALGQQTIDTIIGKTS